MTPEQGFIQWALGQGVAVAILAYVLVRLESRMAELMSAVDRLSAYLQGEHDARVAAAKQA